MKIVEDILPLIPQRHPFVMIDILLFADKMTAKTSFAITADNIFYMNGEFTEAGLLENIAQTAAAGWGYNAIKENRPVTGGYIAAVKNFEVFSMPRINDVLITEIGITNTVFNIIVIEGKSSCNGETVAQCEMKIFSNPSE